MNEEKKIDGGKRVNEGKKVDGGKRWTKRKSRRREKVDEGKRWTKGTVEGTVKDHIRDGIGGADGCAPQGSGLAYRLMGEAGKAAARMKMTPSQASEIVPARLEK